MKPLINNIEAVIISTFLLLPISAGLSFAAITNTTQDLIIPAGETFTICGSTSYLNSVQIDGTLIVKAYDGTSNAGWIEINSPLIVIGSAGKIDANGRGYRANEGPGAGLLSPLGGGAGYGGYCGYPGGPSYGSITQPNDLGSGGGSSSDSGKAAGGPGGGKIKLLVSGTLTNNGSITANGTAGYYAYKGASGGGSGGTIYITANNIAGNGIMTANGGKGFVNSDYNSSGSGGGGRIAVYCQSNDYSGTINACGGNTSNGIKNGGAGTIYKKLSSQTYGELLISDVSGGGKTYISGQFDRIIISSFSAVVSSGSLTAGDFNMQNSSFTNLGSITINTFNLNRGATFYQEGTFAATGLSQISGMFYADAPVSMWNTKILAGGIITHNIRNSNFNMNVGNNLEIMPGGRIDVSGKGYQANEGPGTGSQVYFSGGAGYGGRGGTGAADGPGGISYGNLTEPVDLGSGGASSTSQGKAVGGAGGGKVKLTVAGTLTNNGLIASNGVDGYYSWPGASGGGSGGSIYLIAQTLSGSGAVQAKGGNGSTGSGGGSGGRIAIYAQNYSFSGLLEVNAGSGGSFLGQTGTIFVPGTDSGASVSISKSELLYSQDAYLNETVFNQTLILQMNGNGNLNGTVNMNLSMNTIKTGSFKDKGFSKGGWSSILEGANYSGQFKGMHFYREDERKVYLKGTMDGQIDGIVEGCMTESLPNSGTFDQFAGTCTLRVVGVGGQYNSGKMYLSGTIAYQSSQQYANIGLYYIQESAKGSLNGSYTGAINTIMTNIYITGSSHPDKGEGFGFVTYQSALDSGLGWYNCKAVSENEISIKGIFSNPIFGLISGSMLSDPANKTLWLIIDRLDLGLTPKEDLKVNFTGPAAASPGQTVTYTVELKNDGLKAANNISLVVKAPGNSSFLSSSENLIKYDIADWISDSEYTYLSVLRSDINNVPAKSSRIITIQLKIKWGLPWGTRMEGVAYVLPRAEADIIFPDYPDYGNDDD